MIVVTAMIELLPVFFAATAVVGSAAGASVGALSKAACLRLFRSKVRRLPVRLLLWTAIAETFIMTISLALAFALAEPYATPQPASKGTFFAALFFTSAAFHIAISWFPNRHLLAKMSPAPDGSDNNFADLVWAGILASMTPCAVGFIALWFWSSCLR